MTMRKRVGSVLFTAASAAAVVGLSVGPALAATTLTVKVSHGGSYKAASSGNTILTDGSGATAIHVTCTKSAASGKLARTTDKGKAPLKIGTAAKLSFSKCTGPLGPLTTTVNKTPYAVEANSKTSNKGKTKGDTAAIISGVDVTVSQTGCSFKVTGSAPGYYSNSKHELIMTPKSPVKGLAKAQLTIGDVSGCLGVIVDGQHPTYAATYKISPKAVITSS
jgi:hypothetical protein